MPSFPGPTLNIASGAQESTEAITEEMIEHAEAIKIWAPGTLPETVNLVSTNDAGSSPTYNVEQSNGEDIVIAAGKVVTVRFVGAVKYKVKATANTAAARAFKTRIIERVP